MVDETIRTARQIVRRIHQEVEQAKERLKELHDLISVLKVARKQLQLWLVIVLVAIQKTNGELQTLEWMHKRRRLVSIFVENFLKMKRLNNLICNMEEMSKRMLNSIYNNSQPEHKDFCQHWYNDDLSTGLDDESEADEVAMLTHEEETFNTKPPKRFRRNEPNHTDRGAENDMFFISPNDRNFIQSLFYGPLLQQSNCNVVSNCETVDSSSNTHHHIHNTLASTRNNLYEETNFRREKTAINGWSYATILFKEKKIEKHELDIIRRELADNVTEKQTLMCLIQSFNSADYFSRDAFEYIFQPENA